jgi:hypothetical protein
MAAELLRNFAARHLRPHAGHRPRRHHDFDNIVLHLRQEPTINL